ncbi:MAG: hypothetical protein JNM22_00780 [Saprospiraceae bacterium]|nr:hypothetical protein [Saprospiraceae bacterium]
MGANAPRPPIPSPDSRPGRFLPYILAGIAVLIVCALQWSDVIEYINGEPHLTAKHQKQLQKKMEELDEGEQYALVATTNRMYPCVHNGHSLYFLRVGEVWKYGTTIKGQRGRYSSQFFEDNAVSYIVEFRGTMGECLKQEQIKLFSYPILPENLARPQEMRLLRPPNNPVYK